MLSLRDATAADWAQVYALRNHPNTRQWSGNPAEIDVKDHYAWFRGMLETGTPRMFIARDDHDVVGYVRLDDELAPDATDKKKAKAAPKPTVAEVSIAVAERHRGRGYSNIMLAAAAADARSRGLRKLTARIKAGNMPSLCAFVAAGFSDPYFTDGWVRLVLDL